MGSYIDFSAGKTAIFILALLLPILTLTSGYGFMRIYRFSIKWNFIKQSSICIIIGLGVFVLTYLLLIPFGPLQKSNVLLCILFLVTFGHLLAEFIFHRYWKKSKSLCTIVVPKSIITKFVTFPFCIVLVVFFVSLFFRLSFVLDSFPILPGYDTPAYARTVNIFSHHIPTHELVMGGMPFTDPPLYYMITAILLKLFSSTWIIPVFYTFIDSLVIFPLFLFYKQLSNDFRVVLFGVTLYSFSYFAIRIFQDLQKQVLANFFIFLGLFFLIDGFKMKDDNKIFLAGLLFGCAVNTHYWVSLLLFVFIGLFFIVKIKTQFIYCLKKGLILLSMIILSIIPEELFYTLNGGQSWLKTLSLIIFPSNNSSIGLFSSASDQAIEGLYWLMPSIEYVMVFDLIFLVIGSIFLLRNKSKFGFWFILCSVLILTGSRFFQFGVMISQCYRLWLYYGVFISFFQAIFFICLYELLVKRFLGNPGKELS